MDSTMVAMKAVLLDLKMVELMVEKTDWMLVA